MSIADLELEVALLAAELEQEERELALGYAVKGKRRPLPHELRAAVRFAELDRDVLDTATALERRAATVRDALVDELAVLATDTTLLDDPAVAVDRLRRMRSPIEDVVARIDGGQLTPLAQLVNDVAEQLEQDLTLAAERGAAEVLAEARRQGLDVRDGLPTGLTLEDRAALKATARRLAEQPVTHGLGVAVEAAERLLPGAADGAEVLFGALEAVEEASTASTGDVARQAAAGAQATGRTRAARAIPQPATVYASELLDGNTCDPCAAVDGRTYRTLDDALADYPGAGGFVFCDGGLRCRGTLVYVWDTEAPPTVDDTDPPQGPSDPPDGPDGPIRPIPADDRTTFPRAVDVPLPAAPLPPTVPPATDPATVPVDLELEALGDERLDGAYATALREGDQAAAVRYADELDRRAQLGSAWRDPDAEDWGDVGADLPDLTAEELLDLDARVAAAIDDAGGLEQLEAAFELDKRPGRRIDKVREDYNAEQYRRMMEAEAEGASGFRNAEVAAEFATKFGTDFERLWFGPAREAYYYASEELRAYWAIHGRQSFAEYAVSRGITDAKTVARAKAAAAARADAASRAEEAGSARSEERKRQRQAEARKRRATGAGADLERQRKRFAREAARAEKIDRDLRRAGATVDRVDPPPRILDEPDAEPTPPPRPVDDPDTDDTAEPFLEDVPEVPAPPVIRSWEDGEAWADRHGITITDTAKRDVDPEVFEVFARVYEEAARKYPQIVGNVAEFDRVVASNIGVAASVGPVGPYALGTTFPVRVGVTTNRLPSEERLRLATKVLGESPYDIIVHEFGHVIQASTPNLWARTVKDALRIRGAEPRSILTEALAEAGYTGRGKAGKHEVSIYANTDPMEFFAETFLAFWRGDVAKLDPTDPKRKRLEKYRDAINERVGMRAID